MNHVNSSKPNPPPSSPPQRPASSTTDLLTRSEIEELRREKKRQLDYAREAFRKNPPKA